MDIIYPHNDIAKAYNSLSDNLIYIIFRQYIKLLAYTPNRDIFIWGMHTIAQGKIVALRASESVYLG